MAQTDADEVVTMTRTEFDKLTELVANLDASLSRMREASAAQVAALNRVIELLANGTSTAGDGSQDTGAIEGVGFEDDSGDDLPETIEAIESLTQATPLAGSRCALQTPC